MKANATHNSKGITDEQIIDCLKRGLNHSQAAEELGCSRHNIRNRKAKLIRQGLWQHGNGNDTVPEPYYVKGKSQYYDKDGKPAGVWVKSDIDKEKQHKMMEEAIIAMCEEIPKHKPSNSLPKNTLSDLLNCYVISDYHLGMMAWGEESGADWDLKIAEETLIKWFQQAIKLSPDSKTAIFCNLSDALHWDGLEAVTPANRHVLDADTRFQKVVRVCIRLFRKIIDMLLQKHEKVVMINVGGNHDPASTVWLREMFHSFYGDTDRVEVDNGADLYCCYEHGATSLFFHHGHKRKVGNIDSVFAAKYRDVFGRTKYSYAHMGHLHSVDVKETNLMLIEQHRTLAAHDAYASQGGWISGRDAKVITYHKDYGEVSRVVVGIDMIS